MFTAANRDWVVDVGPGSAVRLVGGESIVAMESRYGAFTASYGRPLRVDTGAGESIPITDHVMLVRLATAAVVLAAIIWRFFGD